MTDTVRVPRAWLEAFHRDTDPNEPIADNGGTVWDMFCHEAAAMLAASPQDEESPREPLEPVVYGDERDELLALIRKRCPDFTAFPERPPEEMVKGGGTERKNDEAIERAFQDFRLAASPQGEGSSADWMKHDGGPNPVPGKRVEVRYRNGETETRTANRLGWNHWEAETPGLGGYDIIAYRVTEGVK